MYTEGIQLDGTERLERRKDLGGEEVTEGGTWRQGQVL